MLPEERIKDVLLYGNIITNLTPWHTEFRDMAGEEPDFDLLLGCAADEVGTLIRRIGFQALEAGGSIPSIGIREEEDQVQVRVPFHNLRHEPAGVLEACDLRARQNSYFRVGLSAIIQHSTDKRLKDDAISGDFVVYTKMQGRS
ncbi:MAG TPA: hypothetical protein VKU19_03765 [Bryobacteraceae bacterium]|nr:hypothetical protein [Bryobacteraceae bacterium]